MKIPFSAASHTFRLPNVSSSLALSLPLKTTTMVFGSLLSEAMLLYTVGLTRVIACKPKTYIQMLFKCCSDAAQLLFKHASVMMLLPPVQLSV